MKLENRAFTEQLIWTVAAVSSVVTLLGFLFQREFEGLLLGPGKKGIIFFGILIICVLCSCFITSRKSSVSFKFNNQFILTVEKGNIFTKKGIIVIPVNEYFDTHVGDGIISPNSVHGKWINAFFRDRVTELDAIITRALSSKQPRGSVQRAPAKSRKYDLGTCINLQEGENTYVLVALTQFDGDNHAFLDRKDYAIVIDKLMSHLQTMHIEGPIYMPLMGTGLSRLGRSPQRILHFLIDAIDFKYSDYTFPNGMFIEIYNINQVNLNQLEYHVENELKL